MLEIEERILNARNNKTEAERLLLDYMPFIRKQASALTYLTIEYEDRVSIAMLTFLNCIQQYDVQKGNFLSYAALVIKSRLIDEERKNNRKIIVIQEEEQLREEAKASVLKYRYDIEKDALHMEMECLEKELELYGITFSDLCRTSPKQKRSRLLCMKTAKQLLQNKAMENEFLTKKRLPQKELAEICGLSIKTIEKYRKYIIALAVLIKGDYAAVRTFLPRMEVEK